jgi:hypothetical protein
MADGPRARPGSVAATGLTNASCSRIRSGASVQHPRHWEPLAGLVPSGALWPTKHQVRLQAVDRNEVERHPRQVRRVG